MTSNYIAEELGGHAMVATRVRLIVGTKATVAASVAIAAISGALVASPAAHADNNSYLGAMNSLGLTSKAGPEGLLQGGKGACSLMRPNSAYMFGRSANVVAQIVWEQNPMLERREAALLVNAAIDHLCPGVNMYGYAAV
jgi:hypothetical protein